MNGEGIGLRARLALVLGMVCLLFAIALALALFGLLRSGTDFSVYRDVEAALQRHSVEIYAHGLQSEQALRNIVLDPKNKQAYDNLAAATKKGREILEELNRLAQGDPALAERVRSIGALVPEVGQLRGRVIDLVRQDNLAEAQRVLVSEETPQWRKLREQLLAFGDEMDARLKVTSQRIQSRVDRSIVMASVGGLLALLAGVGLSIWMASCVIRQIGGEPAYARAAMQCIAGGDLTADIQVAGGEGSLLGEARSMNERLRSLVGEISNGATTVRDNAQQILESARQIAGAADRQSDSTADVAAAVEELTVSVNHISDNARDTENSAARSNDLAAEGQKQVQEAAGEMRQIATGIDGVRLRIGALAERANEVGSIAQVIKEIAGQTNLLALNAAIEAARAGEQGRGFAVVADEVRALAERTAAATQKIETMIGAIQAETLDAVAAITQAAPQVQRGVDLSQNAAETLREIRAGARLALERVRDVANATAEQSAASTVIATRIESIAQQVDSTGAATRHAEDQANSLQQCADGLLAAVARFRV